MPESPTRDPFAVASLPQDPGQRAIFETLQTLGMGALGSKMGMELLEVGPDRTVARMPVEGNTQPFGLWHGGASAVLAESVGSIASYLHAGPGRMALGLELNCTHHRSARTGWVTASTHALSVGRTVATYEIRIVDDEQHLICTARLTCLLRDL